MTVIKYCNYEETVRFSEGEGKSFMELQYNFNLSENIFNLSEYVTFR